MQTITELYLNNEKKKRRFWSSAKRVIPLLSLLVVAGTFWGLKLTGVTMAGEAFCGYEEHIHTQECLQSACTVEEHTHIASCYSDLTADLETAVQWEALLADLPAAVTRGQRLIEVAKSQIGYTESEKNFVVGDDGVRRGYTRYGEWYGNPHGDWSAMFIAFCLEYSDNSNLPIRGGAETMRIAWEEAGIYKAKGTWVPRAGDLIFLDKDGNGNADAVAVITALSNGQISVIEGDLDGQVAEAVYLYSGPGILGFGILDEDDPILMAAPQAAGSMVIGKTVAYHYSLLDSGSPYVIYTQGSDGKYYAVSRYGNAVEVFIGSDGTISTNHGNASDLFWNFERANNYDNQPAYYIKNVSANQWLHPFYNDAYNNAALLAERWESATYASGSGARIRGARQNAYAQLQNNNWFGVATNLYSGSVFYFGRVPATCYVWLDGTNGNLMSLRGSPNQRFDVLEGGTMTLPSNWSSPPKYNYKLRGWYDITHATYYAPGDTVTITEHTVFYADWVAADYDIGEFNALVSNSSSTNEFITTHVFDYNFLFNAQSVRPNITVSATGHSETWNLVQSGTVPYQNKNTLNFIFRDWDANRDISWPQNTNNQNTVGDVYSGLFNATLGEILFGTTNAYNPVNKTGIIGKTYLGTGDHLYHLMTDPSSEHYGYYYYDSSLHAAAYNQSEQRFYIYDYLERTSDSANSDDSGTGKYSDFLPFNSPYKNNNGKYVPTYSYQGDKGEYVGVNHYTYDAKYDSNGSNANHAQANLGFGIRSDVRFYLPGNPGEKDENGNWRNVDLYGNEMHFEFSGDDDVWVLVDGKLVLDVGGIHGVESGTINFATGDVTVNGVKTGTLGNLGEGEHTMTFYYLERGSSQSNCAIYFNLAPRYGMEIKKEDVLTQQLLNGAEFSVFMDKACTIPAKLWVSRASNEHGDAPVNVFTIEDGLATLWGMSPGRTYYIKETKAPDQAGYSRAKGIICLTLDKRGITSSNVEILKEGDDPVGLGFDVYDFHIDEGTWEAYVVISNAPDWVQEVTEIHVEKVWNDYRNHDADSATVFLTVTDPDGTVRRIRRIDLNEGNDWKYTWDNLPKYAKDGVTPIVYGVEEAYTPGYGATVKRISSTEYRFRITNTPLTEETAVAVEKHWNLPEDLTEESYERFQVTMKLFANGRDTGRTVTLSLKNDWKDVFRGLPYKDENGDVIEYTVVESWLTNDWDVTYSDVTVVPGTIPTYRLTVTNHYKWINNEILPSTGGYGAAPWQLVGLALMLTPLVFHYSVKRKQKGGAK